MLIYLQMISSDTDKSAFEQIYNTYRGLMYHVAYARLHHTADAEDAVHHAFVKIAENKIIIKNMRNYRGKDIEKIKKRDADEWWKNWRSICRRNRKSFLVRYL